MKVITLVNEKGGVGKTTLSVHLAAGMAIKGARVLLIDSDPQGHSTHMLNLPEYGGLYRLLVQQEEWERVLKRPDAACWSAERFPDGELLVVPCNVEARVVHQVIDDAGALRDRLMHVADMFDYVVIDTSPTPSMLHSILYFATDYVIYPTVCEDLPIAGIAKSVLRLYQQNKVRDEFQMSKMQLLGVQPTMMDFRTNAHLYGLKLLEQHFGAVNVWHPISHRTIWRDASYARQTLYKYAPTHEATDEVWAFVNKTLEMTQHVNV